MEKVYKVEIKPKTIVITFLLIALAWICIKLYSVFILTFLAFGIAATLCPVVDYLYSKKIPKNVSITIIYTVFFIFIALLLILIYKPLLFQLEAFVNALPNIIENTGNLLIQKFPILKDKFNFEDIFDSAKNSFVENFQIANFSSYLFSGIGKAFGVVGSFVTIIIDIIYIVVLSIYFIQAKEYSKQKFSLLLPSNHKKRIISFINRIEQQLGAWLRAQFFLMLEIGVASFIGFEIIGSNFSIPIGIIAAILTIIPGIGPFITWVLAIIVTIGSNMPEWKIIFITIWFILIQQVENFFIYPKIMEKVVGLNPMLVIITLFAASKILNFWGALLTVPIVVIIQLSIQYYLEYRKEK